MSRARAAVAILLAAALAAGGCARRAEGPKSGQGSAAPPSPPTALTLLTWNVLADEYHDGLRWPALWKTMDQADADVIALNEARPAFVAGLLDQPWARGRYYVAPNGETDPFARFRGDYILTRLHIVKATAMKLPSRQGRGAVIVELSVRGRRLAVATCHADSMLELGAVRSAQLDAIFAALAGADDAVLMGDMNFGDGARPESDHVPAAYIDLWAALRSGQPGFTWNNELNPMARAGAFPAEPSRRIDRVFLRSAVWRGRSIRVIGHAPIGKAADGSDVYPSDHFALAAVVEAVSDR